MNVRQKVENIFSGGGKEKECWYKYKDVGDRV
jgi:hypothetical protein